MKKSIRVIVVLVLLVGAINVAFAGGQQGQGETKGKLVLATLNSSEGQTTKQALMKYSEPKRCIKPAFKTAGQRLRVL